MGKSAQLPLHVLAAGRHGGPTPVSALIHAATMVAAGVYMVGRFNVSSGCPPDLAVIAYTGGITLFIAATIAMVQTDYKKVLAYSTVSQLGFMMLASASAAGPPGDVPPDDARVLQGVPLPRFRLRHPRHGRRAGHAQDGRARSKLPITYWTFLIAALAISGIPPLAGFFSKDAILAGVFEEHRYILFGIGLVTAGMTAFYMFRLVSLTFAAASAARTTRSITSTNHRPP